jgi:hypothetical protein
MYVFLRGFLDVNLIHKNLSVSRYFVQNDGITSPISIYLINNSVSEDLKSLKPVFCHNLNAVQCDTFRIW